MVKLVLSITKAAVCGLALSVISTIPFGDAVLRTAANAAQASQGCGDFYRIKRGDTLRSITLQTLGHDRYAVVYRANRDILRSPEQIVAGQLIYLPCPNARIKSRSVALAAAGLRPSRRDNRGDRWARQSNKVPDGGTASVTVITPTQTKSATRRTAVFSDPSRKTPAAGVRASRKDVLLLTASGFAPLVDEDLPQGGLVTMILAEALKATPTDTEPKLAFVDDRRAHLDVLMPIGAFDLAYPWPAPACEAPRPNSRTEMLCNDFLFSRPLYEIDVVTLAPEGSSVLAAKAPAALEGKRVCRPESFPAVDLEDARWPVTIVRTRTLAKCLDLVRKGEATAASLPALWATGSQAAGLEPVQALTRTIPIHAAAWRANPGARATIDRLDAGLMRLQKSGRWFAMVSQYLSAYNTETADQN